MSKLPKNELRDFVNLVEEFLWLSDKYKSVDMKKAQYYLRNMIEEQENKEKEKGKKYFIEYQDNNSNKNYLIGVLPKLFQDKALFPRNTDLSEFSEYFGIFIKNSEKKSRYEIIGILICAIHEMNDGELDNFVYAISKILKSDTLRDDLRIIRENNAYSWNDVIRALSK